jgi:hypothetical protein
MEVVYAFHQRAPELSATTLEREIATTVIFAQLSEFIRTILHECADCSTCQTHSGLQPPKAVAQARVRNTNWLARNGLRTQVVSHLWTPQVRRIERTGQLKRKCSCKWNPECPNLSRYLKRKIIMANRDWNGKMVNC